MVKESYPTPHLSDEQLQRAIVLNLCIDRMANGEKPNYAESVATKIIKDAAYFGELLETTKDRYGNVRYTAKLTDTQNIASSSRAEEPGIYTADKTVTVSAAFDRQGEYQGIDIDMTDFDKGEYKIHPDGTVVAIKDGQVDELGILRRKRLGDLLSNRYFCMF